MNYEFYLTDKEVIADSMFFYSSHSEIEQMLNKTTADVTDKVLNSKFYDRYLLKRRKNLKKTGKTVRFLMTGQIILYGWNGLKKMEI